MASQTKALVLLILYVLTVKGHIYSVLFDAQDVKQYLSSDSGIASSIEWCKTNKITKVYLETYRDKLLNPRELMVTAQTAFLQAGFNVSGCVCTTQIGKPSNNWAAASCYTNTTTQEQLQAIFEFTASIFDDIIIDDFYFTDCGCSECSAAKDSHEVVVGQNHVHYDDTYDESCTLNSPDCAWRDYREALMLEVSKVLVLEAAKKINPSLKITIKFPNWYDMYQDYGYDTVAQSEIFDEIWVGTESRDYAKSLKPGYFGFFNMRWLGTITQENSHKKDQQSKAGGGWFDWIDSSPLTYVEQARMTVLGGARESFLFVFGGLMSNSGAPDIAALADNIPELQTVAAEVEKRDIIGVAAYKPPNSHGGCVADPDESRQCGGEIYVFDFVGMLGIPLVPLREFPDPAMFPSAFFSIHSLKDPHIVVKLAQYIDSGNPTIITDGLRAKLEQEINFNVTNVFVLQVRGSPASLLSDPQADFMELRNSVISPLNLTFKAPVNVSIFPFSDGSYVVDNFNDYDVTVSVGDNVFGVPARGWNYFWKNSA